MNGTKRLFLAAALLFLPLSAIAGESRTLIMGLWPNELRLMDEGSEKFVGSIQLRYGAVTGYGRTPHTPDYRRLYYITDRMEAVEVVDPEARQVVDELRISTAARRVRILGLSPYPDGSKLILRVVAVGMDIDRFETDDAEYLVYDLKERAVKESFHLPKDIRADFTGSFPFSNDEKTFFVFGRDVFELSVATHEVVSKIVLSTPLEAGYGPQQAFDLYSPEPGIYYGLAGTSDPFLKKAMTGVLRVDLNQKTASSLEVGPQIEANVFALSPDGKTGYAGIKDLAKIDMVSGRIVALKKGFLQGRAASIMILSADGTKLFITGIGNAIQVVDSATLELKRTIPLDRDLMANPLPLPARDSRASR